MTIHGVGYRPLVYQPSSMIDRLWPIAKLEFRVMFRSRWGVLLYLACLAPMFASLVFIVIRMGVFEIGMPVEDFAARMPARTNPFMPDLYLRPVVSESFIPFLIMTFLVSCRAVAKDRATNAMEIYWTRGISPVGYFLAKWFGSVMLVGLGFFVIPLVLWGLAWSMAPDATFFDETIVFFPRALVGFGLFSLVLTGLATGFSALMRSANNASIIWVLLMFGTWFLVQQIMVRLFRMDASWFAINPWFAMRRIVEWIAGTTPTFEFPVWTAVLSMVILSLWMLVMLRRQLVVEDAVA